MKLGINGIGRIGKLSIWNQVARKHFSAIVANIGREVGTGFEDLVDSLCNDSTYGSLAYYLKGHKGGRIIENLNNVDGTMLIDGMPVKILREARNPKDIKWKENDVRLVVDTTGVFRDPTEGPDAVAKGTFRGHMQAGAEKIVLSSPFKIKAKGMSMPDDAVTIVMGINDSEYDFSNHNLISAASCTTTCLAYMVKPLLDHFGIEKFMSASMITVHAATGTQQVLDRMPATNATDLRKNRSILNNIIMTTTGAAKALELVIPEMKDVGFMTKSVRIPTSTGSIAILTLNLRDDKDNPSDRDVINSIYKKFADNSPNLIYSKKQNVSSDIIGPPYAAAIIESMETRAETAFVNGADAPVTQTLIYGWYDNEIGSYINMLGDCADLVAEKM